MNDINKKTLPVQDTLDNILDTDENPIIDGKFLYAYDKNLSFFDRGGQRFLKITTNSSEMPLTQEDILKIDFDKLKGSLNIFKTESGPSIYYTDASGQTFELTQGSGSSVILNHNDILGRDVDDAHPISAITGLGDTLEGLESAIEVLESDLGGKVAANEAIIAGTNTKITYDTKGLVTRATSATLDDIGDGTHRKLSNYVPTTRTVNGQPLSNDVTVTATDLHLGTDDDVTFADLTLGSGTQTWTIDDDTISNGLRFSYNGAGTVILPKVELGEGEKTIAFTDSVPNVGKLITNNDDPQTESAEESFTTDIKLHKIAKTGTYSDLIGKPIIPATTIANKVLVSTTTSGTAKWSDWSSAGFLKTDISGNISIDTKTYSLSSHLHDDRYYTESEIDTLLNSKLNTSLKGSAYGLAELDENGIILSDQLPSYVDDVLEYNSLANFPTTGEASKIYIAQNTNKTYRWSGTSYVEISPSIALGETSSTAYRGDRGKIAYDHSQTTHEPSDAEPNQTVSPGVGMNFAATTGNVTITMGAPSEISISTENSVSGTTHTHKLTLPQDIQTTANPRFAGVELGAGNETWEIYDHATSQKLTFKLGNAIIELDGSSGEDKTIAFTDNISPTIDDWLDANENNIANALLVYESLQKNYPEIIDLTGGL